MIFFAFIISFFTGILTLNWLFKNSQKMDYPLRISLSFVFGLGICAILTFLSFILFGKFNQPAIIILTVLYLALFLYLNNNTYNRLYPKFGKIKFSSLFQIACFLIASIAIYYISIQNRYGGWDAWAIWNLKMKMLILSNQPFKDIFERIHIHAHPDYPLFLPLLNTWIYAFSKADLNQIPFITTNLLTIFCPVLLFFGLKQFIKHNIAFLAGALLILHPYYVFRGVTQYADLLLGIYLLSSFIYIFQFTGGNESKTILLAGLFLGIMTFIKNEGIVLSGLLSLFTFLFLLKLKKPSASIKSFLIGLGIGLIPTLIFKIFLAPSNPDILPILSEQGINFFKPNEFFYVISAFAKETLRKEWCYTWFVFFIMFLFGFKKYFQKENSIGILLFVSYLIMVALIYTTSTEGSLEWWIKTSLARLYFALLPSIIFYCYYCFYRE